jgi:hypothetical protein
MASCGNDDTSTSYPTPTNYSLRNNVNAYSFESELTKDEAYEKINSGIERFTANNINKKADIDIYSKDNGVLIDMQRSYIDDSQIVYQFLNIQDESIRSEYYLTESVGKIKNYSSDTISDINKSLLEFMNITFKDASVTYQDIASIEDLSEYRGGLLDDGNYLIQFVNSRTSTLIRYIINIENDIIFDSRVTKADILQYTDRSFSNIDHVEVPSWVSGDNNYF